jgi:hypothetical protein
MFSFITFILEDEHGLSLGVLMHVKCIHNFVVYCAKMPNILQLYYIY